jgi:hypothetical protein
MGSIRLQFKDCKDQWLEFKGPSEKLKDLFFDRFFFRRGGKHEEFT